MSPHLFVALLFVAPESSFPSTGGSSSLLASLERLDRSLAQAEARLETVDAQAQKLRDEIARLEVERAAATVRQQEAFARLTGRVRALARMPVGARVALLNGSGSLNEYLETARVLRWLAAHDHRLHEHYRVEAARLRELTEQSEARRAELRAAEAAITTERDALARERQERLDLLRSISTNKDLALRAAGESSAADRELAATVRKLAPARRAASFAQSRGSLPWPAVGRVTLPFSEAPATSSGTGTSHSGLDIAAPAGGRVQAIAAGRIVFADWLRGYGRVVIVDHGDQYHSLVAHLASTAVHAGDEIEQGATLGTVGDSGSLRGTLLYFEIRHRGLPVNPAGWLRR